MTEQGESGKAKTTSEVAGGCSCSSDGRCRRSCTGRGEGCPPAVLHGAGAARGRGATLGWICSGLRANNMGLRVRWRERTMRHRHGTRGRGGGGKEMVSAGQIRWVWTPDSVGRRDSAMASRWRGYWLVLQRHTRPLAGGRRRLASWLPPVAL